MKSHYSLKINYTEQGNDRFILSTYRNPESLLELLFHFNKEHVGCDIVSVSLVKTVFTDKGRRGGETTVGEIVFPNVSLD